MSNHAYILFYQKRGIDFDKITNYEAIRNALQPDDQIGKQDVRFPIFDPALAPAHPVDIQPPDDGDAGEAGAAASGSDVE